MMISSKGRYALRVMLDMAEQSGGGNIRLKDIAARQNISVKYLESIMTALCKSGLVESALGKDGGYRLRRAPEAYTAGEILRAAEGELAPVSCLTEDGKKQAERIYERHTVLTEWLVSIGVDEGSAAENACRLEHDFSDEVFAKLKADIEKRKA